MTATNITLAPTRCEFDRALIENLDGYGPRYTSYPTADRFTTVLPSGIIDIGCNRGRSAQAPGRCRCMCICRFATPSATTALVTR